VLACRLPGWLPPPLPLLLPAPVATAIALAASPAGAAAAAIAALNALLLDDPGRVDACCCCCITGVRGRLPLPASPRLIRIAADPGLVEDDLVIAAAVPPVAAAGGTGDASGIAHRSHESTPQGCGSGSCAQLPLATALANTGASSREM
jgi:hypothetical protein